MSKYICYKCEYDYLPFSAPFLPTAEEMISKGYIPPGWKKHTDPRKPVLDLIDSLQGEAGYASGGDVYARVYSALDVHEILNEIQQAVEDMEV